MLNRDRLRFRARMQVRIVVVYPVGRLSKRVGIFAGAEAAR